MKSQTLNLKILENYCSVEKSILAHIRGQVCTLTETVHVHPLTSLRIPYDATFLQSRKLSKMKAALCAPEIDFFIMQEMSGGGV
ncbi:MAG: hypothetical protein ACOY3I_09355 [Verrucomicrobiota bacterium]